MAQLQKKKPGSLPISRLLVIIIVISLLGFGGYNVYLLIMQTQAQSESNESANVQKVKIQSTDWGKTLFNRPDFQSLKSNIDGPIEPGTPGNKDPFSRPTE